MGEVVLENVTKRFGKVVAVDNVNLKIKDKEFFVLLGPSGCGKTTTLRLIAGLEYPDEGRIYIDGVDVTFTEPKDRDIAMVFQNYALYPHMTVFDNIAFPLAIKKKQLGLTKEDIKKRVLEVAKLLRIEELLNRKPGQLSGGQQQRVALARALIRRPKVWLMDEPLSNLDALLRLAMRAEIKRLQKKLGITTIYVTHDQAEALSMADRIAVMNQGKVMQVGTPDEIYLKPQHVFVGTFIGAPPMNIIECIVEETKEGYKLKCPGFERKIPSEAAKYVKPEQKILLGMRPEFVDVYKEPVEDSIKAKVLVVEPLGSETILNVDINPGGEESLVKIKLVKGGKFNTGDIVYLKPDWTKIVLFDATTGKALA
ncbi:ABC transporter ATP-binding protein [Desulfurococcaceae archaeon MEX13E-LK6-19]|nr:ABC transporter ATP-binding protein [Desulfurococcaceae archaeon MEX13E-LK6-19]